MKIFRIHYIRFDKLNVLATSVFSYKNIYHLCYFANLNKVPSVAIDRSILPGDSADQWLLFTAWTAQPYCERLLCVVNNHVMELSLPQQERITNQGCSMAPPTWEQRLNRGWITAWYWSGFTHFKAICIKIYISLLPHSISPSCLLSLTIKFSYLSCNSKESVLRSTKETNKIY